MIIALTEEIQLIQETVRRFCDRELSYDYVRWMDDNVNFPPDELWQKVSDIGVFSAPVPVEYGGQGHGIIENTLIYEEICRKSMSVALAVGATVGFGVRFLVDLGTQAQKQAYLPKIAAGQLRTSMALTEPGGGTAILGSLSPRPRIAATTGASTAARSSSPGRIGPI
ncbi:MAG: acyl-CoA dehydrogenase family protein [Pseudodonghicola sp.]